MSRHRRATLDGSQHLPPTPIVSRSLILSPQEANQFDEWSRKLMGTSQPITATVRAAFFVLGAAMLLGWNVIITAIPYFLTRLDGSPFQSTFSSYISLTSTIANFFCLWYATVTSSLQASSRRIFLSIVLAAILNILFTLSTLANVSPTLFFSFVILNGVLQAAAAAYLQTAVVALASLFGSGAVQSVMSGQAAVGVAVSLVQVISTAGGVGSSKPSTGPTIIAVYPHPSDWGAFSFFFLASLFMITTLGAQTFISKTRHYRFLMNTHNNTAGETSPLLSSVSSLASIEPSDESSTKFSVKEMFILNKTYNFAVAFIFVITLAVFPPITTLVTSVNADSGALLSHPLVFSAVHFLVFSVGDLVGRFIPSTPKLTISSPKLLLTLSLSRIVFIPLFLLCKINADPPLINSDIIFFGLVLLLGISNGYGGSTIMVASSSLELNPRLKGNVGNVDTAATVASFSLVSGLAIGSLTSFAVRMVICGGCNPFVT